MNRKVIEIIKLLKHSPPEKIDYSKLNPDEILFIQNLNKHPKIKNVSEMHLHYTREELQKMAAINRKLRT